MLPSASLVPSETDPTVLFTTAGMQQFKRYYSNPEEAPAACVATIQKCIRTGDIDEVGDKTHNTFFEMLGNFSFGYPKKEGSYFKEEAIKLAWMFLTSELGVAEERIYATYFKGERGVPEDRESLEILQSIDGLGKVIAQGFDDNFWSLGTENSPGGPTVEFYIDGIEVWNLVFNEYILKSGVYELSEQKGVDTGMGLERLSMMMQEADNLYETDLFKEIIQEIEKLSGKKYRENEKEIRIIADHIRAATLAINDGVVPSNKDQGYVVRRLIRRAIVKAHQIGLDNNFTAKLADTVMTVFDGFYFYSSSDSEKSDTSRRVSNNKDVVLLELEKEENKFRRTLSEGLRVLNSYKEVKATELFNLYQSFGMPLEISIEELDHRGIAISGEEIEKFDWLKREHQEKSRTAAAGFFKGGLAEAGEITAKYHTATHLLLAALRQVLGDQIFQRGSNITAERMRFDFSYPDKMTPEQIKKVEGIVNEKIKADLPVDMKEMSLEDAKQCGAMGIFESKYGDKVKVYTIGSSTPGGRSLREPADSSEPRTAGSAFSREICGGPHASHTGELGHFKITKEESSSAGVRRIKAILE